MSDAPDDLSKAAENAAYTAVGLGVLGFHHLQVQRRRLERALQDFVDSCCGSRPT
ncbi:MAG TPA: hypothetical protein VE575_16240 [Acidimicrobiales bacterium]|nr:hypothetical protein [Acidimicrobiales bacterium]